MKAADISGKKREYLKEKINELAMNITNKNIRGMYKGIN
jgi:predicted nuclease of restriction endonuclease-like RecB superfamily